MEQDISKVDKNFALETAVNRDGMDFYNVLNDPFRIYGVFMDEGVFCRLPQAVARTVSDGVACLCTHTAGGRVKFKTDSKRIAILAKEHNVAKMSHFAFCGSIGFDLYQKQNGREQYAGTFIPPIDLVDGYESTLTVESNGLTEYTVNFPLYSGVTELLIGIEETATLEKADGYAIPKPIVFYGSSITQGGCASRPGTCYQAYLSRDLNVDHLNLGFSGSARAETEIIDYIKQLDMSAFVYDYDHNAPDTAHLQKTHEAGFLAIREQNPDLPILLLSRPKYYLTGEDEERRAIIKTTYEHALQNGDRNVFFLDGKQLMAFAEDHGTVDNCHPTDLGFFSMAKALREVLKPLL